MLVNLQRNCLNSLWTVLLTGMTTFSIRERGREGGREGEREGGREGERGRREREREEERETKKDRKREETTNYTNNNIYIIPLKQYINNNPKHANKSS